MKYRVDVFLIVAIVHIMLDVSKHPTSSSQLSTSSKSLLSPIPTLLVAAVIVLSRRPPLVSLGSLSRPCRSCM